MISSVHVFLGCKINLTTYLERKALLHIHSIIYRHTEKDTIDENIVVSKLRSILVVATLVRLIGSLLCS